MGEQMKVKNRGIGCRQTQESATQVKIWFSENCMQVRMMPVYSIIIVAIGKRFLIGKNCSLKEDATIMRKKILFLQLYSGEPKLLLYFARSPASSLG